MTKTPRGRPVFLQKQNKGTSALVCHLDFLEGKNSHCVTEGDGITLLNNRCVPSNWIPERLHNVRTLCRGVAGMCSLLVTGTKHNFELS